MRRRWKDRPLGRVEFDDGCSTVCDPTTRASWQLERTRAKVLNWTVGKR